MPAMSPDDAAIASNAAQASLRTVAAALAAAPLDRLATAIAKDDSTVCRIRSEETKITVSDAIRLLCACGLKVVRADRVCVDRASYEALTTIAQRAMAMPEVARRLVWDGED